MINTCPACGLYSTEHITDKINQKVYCKFCGEGHSFKFKNLLILTGSSGSGKTTILHQLQGIPRVILLEGDILWNDYYNQPDTHYLSYFNQLLRLCKNLNQSENLVLVANSGLGVPSNIKPCEESRFFNQFIYLHLTCSDESLIRRLKARPAWRKSGGEQELQNQLNFKKWLDDRHQGHTLDTTKLSIQESTERVRQWILGQLKIQSSSND